MDGFATSAQSMAGSIRLMESIRRPGVSPTNLDGAPGGLSAMFLFVHEGGSSCHKEKRERIDLEGFHKLFCAFLATKFEVRF